MKDQKFFRLTVIEKFCTDGKKNWWLCACECGNETVVQTASLVAGATKSCGCLKSEWLKKHIQSLKDNAMSPEKNGG